MLPPDEEIELYTTGYSTRTEVTVYYRSRPCLTGSGSIRTTRGLRRFFNLLFGFLDTEKYYSSIEEATCAAVKELKKSWMDGEKKAEEKAILTRKAREGTLCGEKR